MEPENPKRRGFEATAMDLNARRRPPVKGCDDVVVAAVVEKRRKVAQLAGGVGLENGQARPLGPAAAGAKRKQQGQGRPCPKKNHCLHFPG